MENISRLGMEFGQHILQQVSELLLAHLSPKSLSEMERGLREMLVKLGSFLLSAWLTVQDAQYPSDTIDCRCGAQARYREKREGVLCTVLGRITYRRAYYLCDGCHEGTYPLDDRLGLRPGELSAELESLSALIGAQLPFGQGSDLFERLTLVSISPQSLDKATQAMGGEMQQVETEWIARSQDADELLRQEREEAPLPRLYGALDAVKVHTDERNDETDKGWRDLKVGVWFETEARPPATPDQEWEIQARNQVYFCDIQEAETFGQLVWATGVERRAHRAVELVFVADGAEWIWNLVGQHYPQAIQIVDWFHATEYLTPVAALAGDTPEKVAAWLQQARDDLWSGRLDQVLAACAQLVTTGRKDDVAQKAVTYFTNNRHRMNYPDYRAKGYQIGSGTVESGCKQLGVQRLQVSGATWSKEGVRKVAKARAAYLSHQWDMLTDRRAHRRPYPPA